MTKADEGEKNAVSSTLARHPAVRGLTQVCRFGFSEIDWRERMCMHQNLCPLSAQSDCAIHITKI